MDYFGGTSSQQEHVYVVPRASATLTICTPSSLQFCRMHSRA
jgi:hypothetical protein